MRAILLIVGLSTIWQSVFGSSLKVKTPSGTLVGWEATSRGGRTYQAWTKVPYAQPPVGKLRLEPPKPSKPWSGVLNATSSSPTCMQSLSAPPGMPMSKEVATEDCLYLDIYRPKNLKTKHVPVLVYVHGGAFSIGTVAGKRSADYLMDEDVILVQVSYRVNGFGFMSLNDDVLPGNYGHKDQAEALAWLDKNIESFGGNRKKMTVFGESSGGASAHHLLKSPLSSKYLAGAVSHSGSINHVSTTLDADFVKNNTLTVAAKVGCKGKDSLAIVKCLKNANANKLMDAIAEVSDDPIQLFFAPVIEPKTVKYAFASVDTSLQTTSKPWIITFANGEYQLYKMMLSSKPDYVKNAAKDLDSYLAAFLAKHNKKDHKIQQGVTILKNAYFKPNLSYNDFLEQLAKMHADNNFLYPAITNSNLHEGKSWLCQLEYTASSAVPDIHLAGHASHTDFYFNREGSLGKLQANFPDVSKRLIKYMVNFANHGNPTPPGSKFIWPQFNSTEMLRVVGDNDVISTKEFFQKFQKLSKLWYTTIGWR